MEQLITDVLYQEIRTAIDRDGIFFDYIDLGTVIVEALNTAFKTALDEAINKVIDKIDIEDITSTYKLQLLYDAVQARLDLNEVENELDLILTSVCWCPGD